MNNVVICIATYKRPKGLEKALRALELLETEARVRVLVAENDSAGREGSAVVKELVSQGYRFPLSSIVVPDRGIPQARNAVLKTAFEDESVDFIAFMDDDQWPEPKWLDSLLEMQRKTGAEVVWSAVLPDFESEPPSWARTCHIYTRETTKSGIVNMIYGTNGVLMAKSLKRRLTLPWFDNSFALTGGEDSDLFHRLRALGVRFARAQDSVIHESYPASRINLLWVLSRAYRNGSAHMRIAARHSPVLSRLATEGIKIVGAFIFAPVQLVIALGDPGKQVNALCSIARACGKISALFGGRYNEYLTIHGS